MLNVTSLDSTCIQSKNRFEWFQHSVDDEKSPELSESLQGCNIHKSTKCAEQHSADQSHFLSITAMKIETPYCLGAFTDSFEVLMRSRSKIFMEPHSRIQMKGDAALRLKSGDEVFANTGDIITAVDA